VNEAYGVLKDPYRRGEYLLRLEGGKTAHEDKSVAEGFLESMLEEREALEAAMTAGGDALAGARKHFQDELAALARQLARGFAELAAAADRTPKLAALRRTLNVMAYYRGLLRDLREAAHHE
jgi:DnaJ-domain-containing protein 1